MSRHTPGPWRLGWGQSVVADHPVDDGPLGCADTHIYGGHLIAESIAPQNAPVIAAAPDLLEACKAFVAACREQDIKLGPITWMAIAAVARAEGRWADAPKGGRS